MENKNKYLIITFIFIAVIIITGTFAWLSYRSKKTSLVFTVGDMNNMQVTLKPYQIDATIDPELDYTDVEYTEVTAINNRNVKMNYALFYDIEEIDSALQSTDFKYTIERSTNNGSTYTVYKTGNFSTANTTNDFIILDEDVPEETTYKYRVYIWVDGYTNPNTGIEGATFKGELRAEILGIARAYLVDTSGTATYYKEEAYRTKIVNASFVDYIDTSNAVKTYDMGVNSNKPVTAWLEAATEPDTYNLYIGSEYRIYGTILKQLFRGMTSLKNINFTNLDTSDTENMSGMFLGCVSLTALDLSSFNTSSVTGNADTTSNAANTGMSYMFHSCRNLTFLNISSFDTSNVVTMYAMFNGCISLTVLDLSNFDTSNVTTMQGMFANQTGFHSNLTTIMFGEKFDTSNVTDMLGTFYKLDSLTNLDLSNFDTSNVTKTYSAFGGMFQDCTNLTTIYVSELWNMSNNTSSTNMFLNDTNLPNYNGSVVDKTNAHYNTGGYLTYKAYTPPSNS